MTDLEINKEFSKIEELLAKQKPSEALKTVHNTRKVIDKKTQKWLLGKSYFWENLCYKHLHNKRFGFSAADKGIEIFKELGDLLEVSKIQRDKGLLFGYIGENEKALKSLKESLNTLVDTKHVEALGVTLSKIGNTYLNLDKLDLAEKYSDLGYKICKISGNKFFIVTSILPLSLCYYYTGNHIAGLDLIEEAEKILKLLKKENGYENKRRMAEVSLRKSLLLLGVNMDEKSKREFKKFLSLLAEGEGITKEHFHELKEFKEVFDLLKRKKNLKMSFIT